MSNRLFQGIIHQMKDAVDRVIGVVDETSVVIACSELGRIGEVNENINSETLSATVPFVINGCTYKAFGNSAVLTLDYTAKLNEGAVVGADGNYFIDQLEWVAMWK